MDGASGCVPVKVVVVGDCQCGKTCLIQRYMNNTYTENYQPTGFETHTTKYKVSKHYSIDVSIWDTSGDAGYSGVRPLSYDGADLIIICFSIADPDSLENVAKTWAPEVRTHCAEQPILLVGCKSDVRADETHPIKLKQEMMSSYEQGLELAKQIGALVYTETSARVNAKSVQDVLEVAALSAAAVSSQPPAEETKSKPKRNSSFLSRIRFSKHLNSKSEQRTLSTNLEENVDGVDSETQKVEHRTENRTEQRTGHKNEHRVEHRTEHRLDHRSEHASEHRKSKNCTIM